MRSVAALGLLLCACYPQAQSSYSWRAAALYGATAAALTTARLASGRCCRSGAGDSDEPQEVGGVDGFPDRTVDTTALPNPLPPRPANPGRREVFGYGICVWEQAWRLVCPKRGWQMCYFERSDGKLYACSDHKTCSPPPALLAWCRGKPTDIEVRRTPDDDEPAAPAPSERKTSRTDPIGDVIGR